MSDSDEEIVKPPERRAPSARASKGNRMSRLIADEVDDEDKEDAADKDFYQQGFWADEEEDDDFNGDADDEDGRDSFDSDFGDSTESDDDDDDDDEKKAKRAPAPKKKSVYKDPKLARKKEEAGGASTKPMSKKRARSPATGEIVVEARSRGSLRASTQGASAEAEENRKRLEAAAAARREKLEAMGAKRGVELRRLTQAEILAEAAQTEIINRASLERMLRQEEDKRRVISRERNVDGPRIKFHSKRQGETVTNTLTFTDMPIPPVINAAAAPYPPPQRCAVSQAPAKYLDPLTGQPYATLDAFKMLRGRTGRRQHSFSAPGIATLGGDE